MRRAWSAWRRNAGIRLGEHDNPLMDKRLMELVDWNQGKEVQHFEPVSAQVPDEGDVLLASG